MLKKSLHHYQLKKVFLIIVLALAGALPSSAQYIKAGDWSGSVQLHTGTRRSFGIGVGAQYVPLEYLRADLNFNYYFEVNYDLNLNAHYLIDVYKKRLTVYPFVGFTAANLDTKKPVTSEKQHESRESHIGMNLGAGIEYRVDYDIALMLEARHTLIKHIGMTDISAGVKLTF